jgi:hypothetical protein
MSLMHVFVMRPEDRYPLQSSQAQKLNVTTKSLNHEKACSEHTNIT